MADLPELLLGNQTVGPLFADVGAAALRLGAGTLWAGGRFRPRLRWSFPLLPWQHGPAHRTT